MLLALPTSLFCQTVKENIDRLKSQTNELEHEIAKLNNEIDSLKLLEISSGLEEMGWPDAIGELVVHSAMALAYDEEYEMARWVAHVISKDVAKGNTSRTNDFRTDPLVSTGTAQEADYFLKHEDQNKNVTYDGFGYDRGHLAPSADFRWSPKALSESYFYSNMSPQLAEFNREAWADLEGSIRQYAIQFDVNLFVVTGPILNKDLKRIEQSKNAIAIPNYFYKVILDTTNLKAIGFLMPNEACSKPLEAYATSVDDIEALTSLDFFPNFNPEVIEKLESLVDPTGWIGGTEGDYPALSPKVLNKKQINTIQAYDYVDIDKKIQVCGTVSSTHKSKKGNIFINLDKQFPNAVFTLTIWSREAANFSYSPEVDLKTKRICAYGKVTRGKDNLQMNIQNEKQINILEEGI